MSKQIRQIEPSENVMMSIWNLLPFIFLIFLSVKFSNSEEKLTHQIQISEGIFPYPKLLLRASTDLFPDSSPNVTDQIHDCQMLYYDFSSSKRKRFIPDYFALHKTTLPATDDFINRNLTEAQGGDFAVVQLRDVDRESRDHFFITVKCDVNNFSIISLIQIQVTDINDNTPQFVISSLTSVIDSNVVEGSPIMMLRATDLDQGINAKLKFSLVPGSVRRKLPGNTTLDFDAPNIFVFDNGDVVSFDNITMEMNLYLKVVVKDRWTRADGNRKTATATISILPSSPKPTPSTSLVLPLWEIVVISTSSIILVILIFLVIRHLYKKGAFNRSSLRLNASDDGTIIDDLMQNAEI